MQITTQPMEFFKQFITNELLEEITFHTNLYNTQRATRGYKTAVKRRGSSQTSFREIEPVTKVELQQVFGIILYMGVHKLPSRRMYWGNKTVVPLIANTMSRNRYEEILSVLHFNNNEEAPINPADPNYDKLYKLKPLIKHFRDVFKGSVSPETMQAIDEMMIPFKGRHCAKHYMPKNRPNGATNCGVGLECLDMYMILKSLDLQRQKVHHQALKFPNSARKLKCDPEADQRFGKEEASSVFRQFLLLLRTSCFPKVQRYFCCCYSKIQP